MTARRRGSAVADVAAAATKEAQAAAPPPQPPSAASSVEHQIAPSKWPKVLSFSLLFIIPYMYPGGNIKIPESLGIAVGIVFLVLAILFQYFNFTADSNWLVEYNAALASICFMTLLGFVDDVLDVPWRVKLLLPSFAALPLLMAYAGHTTIIIPKPLIPYVGQEVLDLGDSNELRLLPFNTHAQFWPRQLGILWACLQLQKR
ncbi:hypothetical protein Dimus_002155 [Dionaea muscipula]